MDNERSLTIPVPIMRIALELVRQANDDSDVQVIVIAAKSYAAPVLCTTLKDESLVSVLEHVLESHKEADVDITQVHWDDSDKFGKN